MSNVSTSLDDISLLHPAERRGTRPTRPIDNQPPPQQQQQVNAASKQPTRRRAGSCSASPIEQLLNSNPNTAQQLADRKTIRLDQSTHCNPTRAKQQSAINSRIELPKMVRTKSNEKCRKVSRLCQLPSSGWAELAGNHFSLCEFSLPAEIPNLVSFCSSAQTANCKFHFSLFTFSPPPPLLCCRAGHFSSFGR